MRFLRPVRQAAACRLFALVIPALLFRPPTLVAAELTGTVVDSSGRLVPRALVRVLGASGSETSQTFTDESGAFALTAEGTCRVEAALAGFRLARAPGDAA